MSILKLKIKGIIHPGFPWTLGLRLRLAEVDPSRLKLAEVDKP